MTFHGGNRRPDGGPISRCRGTAAHGLRNKAALGPDHPASAEARTMFPTSVVSAEASPRLLVSGHNSAKIGRRVTKGPWRGLPIFTLTLEERATCPRSCWMWLECYGNAMPFARRHKVTDEFLPRLAREIFVLMSEHPAGIVVRLHVLGDFFSAEYVGMWSRFLTRWARLRVFGYTAHPADSPIGRMIGHLNHAFPRRCAIRFSVSPETEVAPMQATVQWQGAPALDGIVCPAQTGRTAACATCGLCWHPNATEKRIVFIGHGMNRGRKRKEKGSS